MAEVGEFREVLDADVGSDRSSEGTLLKSSERELLYEGEEFAEV